MPHPPLSILFLCTGNSARSILAEAIANQSFGEALRAASAGSSPQPVPHPLALETLRRHGLDTRGLASKSWQRLLEKPFDLVITLCDAAAAEPCPSFPGAPAHVHWSLPDPPAASDPPAAFEAVYATLQEALETLAYGEEADPAARARLAGEEIRGEATRR
jgi:protein-tyrosine-phosphatase